MNSENKKQNPKRTDLLPPGKSEAVAGGSSGDFVQSFFPDVALVTRALEAASIGVWAWDISTEKVTWSRNLERLHRLPPGSFEGTLSFFESDIHPDDRPMVVAAIRESLATGRPYSVTYRLPARPDLDERWISSSGTVIIANGAPQKLFGVCRDVTPSVQTEHELRMRAQRQEVVAQLGARALTEEDLQKLLDDVTNVVATMLDVDLVNILELVSGDAGLLFRSGYGWEFDAVKATHVSISPGSQASYTLAAPGPVLVSDLRSETRFTPSRLLLDHGAISGMSTTIVGHDNRKYGIFSVHTRRPRLFNEYDVALLTSVANIVAGAIQRRQLDQRQKVMIRELHHRSGNLFSQLLALFSQTASNSKSLTELVLKYEARVLALANAHRLMVEGGWQPASLLELLGTQLGPYLDRIALSGPNVYLEPASAFSISTAAHELVSNAIKHGSLSALSGRVDVNWSIDRSESGLTLVLDWKERDGPAPKRLVRLGFGSRLIDTVVERQMNGKVRRTFLGEGMTCRLTIPLAHERWPERER
ncbi:MAG: PAS domain-containing protein [Rhizobiales bacterium]|nr:PAS domain-containing protein [Hyphomicrobiales bacterium]